MAKLLQKQLSFFLLLAILCTKYANAQYYSSDDHLFIGGIYAGGNFTQVDGDNFAGYHNVGLNVGGVLFKKIGEKIAPSLELLYAQKGSRQASGQTAPQNSSMNILDYRIKLKYAEMPILLNYIDEHKTNFGAGFSFAYLISSKETYKNTAGAVFEQDAKLFPFRKYDVGFVLNGSAHLWKGFCLNVRFQYSMFSVRSIYNNVTGRPQQFNNVWTIRGLYLF